MKDYRSRCSYEAFENGERIPWLWVITPAIWLLRRFDLTVHASLTNESYFVIIQCIWYTCNVLSKKHYCLDPLATIFILIMFQTMAAAYSWTWLERFYNPPSMICFFTVRKVLTFTWNSVQNFLIWKKPVKHKVNSKYLMI